MRKIMYVAANGVGRGRKDAALDVFELEGTGVPFISWRGSSRSSCRLSSPPKSVVKIVESASKMSPARSPAGGIQRNMLNSRFPASRERMRPSTYRSADAPARGWPLRRRSSPRSAAGACERRTSSRPRASRRVSKSRGDREGHGLRRPGQRRGAQAPLVFHRNAEPLHQRARVRAEALLAGHEAIAVMAILHVAHVEVVATRRRRGAGR